MKTYGRKSRGRQKYDPLLNFDLVCRLCLSEDGEMRDIFQEEQARPTAPPIPLQIMACVSVQPIYENDSLPTQICEQCRESIDKFYLFRQKCLESEAHLRKALKHMQRGKEKEEAGEKKLQLLRVKQERAESGAEGGVGEEGEEEEQEEPSPMPSTSAKKKVKSSMDELLVVCEKRSHDMQNAAITATPEGTFLVQVADYTPHKVPASLQCSMVIDLPSEATRAGRVTETIAGINDNQEYSGSEGDEEYEEVEEMELVEYEELEELEEEAEEVAARPKILGRKLHPQAKRAGAAGYSYVYAGEQQDGPILPFDCVHCPKRFAKRIDLRRHLSIHQDKKVLGLRSGFDCDVCDKWFPNQTTLRRHERSHTGERPFECDECHKAFSQAGILQRHMMTHTGVKPYVCEVCQKGFVQREGLKTHLRTHAPKNPDEIQLHECPLCEKSFCHPSGLSRHLLIHTGKTFNCSACHKGFTDPSSLRRHERRHGEQVAAEGGTAS